VKYRKKPVVIEARQLTMDNAGAITNWCKGTRCPVRGVFIQTLEGGDYGDYIIKGVQGEFYPCKPDIFEQTYEPTGGDGDE